MRRAAIVLALLVVGFAAGYSHGQWVGEMDASDRSPE